MGGFHNALSFGFMSAQLLSSLAYAKESAFAPKYWAGSPHRAVTRFGFSAHIDCRVSQRSSAKGGLRGSALHPVAGRVPAGSWSKSDCGVAARFSATCCLKSDSRCGSDRNARTYCHSVNGRRSSKRNPTVGIRRHLDGESGDEPCCLVAGPGVNFGKGSGLDEARCSKRSAGARHSKRAVRRPCQWPNRPRQRYLLLRCFQKRFPRRCRFWPRGRILRSHFLLAELSFMA
jgi:hypothetical protein